MPERHKLTSSQLQQFQWYGTNQLGKKVTGIIFANTEMAARLKLKQQHIRIKRLRQRKASIFFRTKQNFKPKDITAFTRQLATMLSTGIPIIQAIKMIVSTQSNIAIKAILSQICNQVEAGALLSESMRTYPNLFNNFYCDLLATGEQTGKLDQVFERLANYREKTEQLKAKVIKAMIYPTMVILVASIITILMLTMVIPEFENMFSSMGAELPWFTQQVIKTSHFIQNHGLFIIAILFSMIMTMKLTLKRSLRFQLRITRSILKVPVIGNILSKAAIAKFSRTLATSVTAGIPIINALVIASKTSGNLHYQFVIEAIHQDIASGVPIYVAMRKSHAFPEMVLQMVMIGEESGKLDDMLNKIASIYESDVDDIVDNLSKIIEPVIIIFLGVIVGGLVVSLYLPIFNMASVF